MDLGELTGWNVGSELAWRRAHPQGDVVVGINIRYGVPMIGILVSMVLALMFTAPAFGQDLSLGAEEMPEEIIGPSDLSMMMVVHSGLDSRLIVGIGQGISGSSPPHHPGGCLIGPCSGPGMGVIHRGLGYAVKDNQTFRLRLDVERVRPVRPGDVWRLLSSNLTLEEIGEHLARETSPRLRGALRMNGYFYRLDNISQVEEETGTDYIEALLQGPWQGRGEMPLIPAGKIWLRLNDSGQAQGELVLWGPPENQYQIFLDMSPAPPIEEPDFEAGQNHKSDLV